MSSADNKRQRLEDGASTSTSDPGGQMADKSPTKSEAIGAGEAIGVVSKVEFFSEEAQDFAEIVTLPGFVDRSLFLKEFLDPRIGRKRTQVMISAPTKFGKTVNLNMSHLFFDIERDADGKAKRDVTRDPTDDELNSSESMKVFRRHSEDQSKWCKILADEKFVEKHFGRYPVVHLNFKQLEAKCEKDAISGCAELVQTAYFQHKYLRNSIKLCDDDPEIENLKETCQDWCFYKKKDLEQLTEQNVYSGLLNLIESLRVHWKRDPIFLVDEIDYPTVEAIKGKVDGDEITMIGTIISKMVCKIVKSDTPILAGALITGISYLAGLGLSSISNTTPHYDLNDPRFSKYYGLTHEEVTGLVNEFIIESEHDYVLETITAWYNGYQGGGARYCLYSVLSYIREYLNPEKEEEKLIFWVEGGLLANIADILKDDSSPLMKDIETLLSGGSITVTRAKKIDGKDLVKMFDEKQKINRDTIFSFFFERGYLAHNPSQRTRQTVNGIQIYLKIPNLEVRSSYYVMFKKYYYLKTPERARLCCATFFRDIPPNVTKDSPEFQIKLATLHEQLQEMFQNAKCTNEASVGALMWVVMNDNAGYAQCEQELTIKERNDKEILRVIAKIDLWMRREKFAVIWEFKYNVTARGDNTGAKDKTALAALEDILPPPEGNPKQNPRSTKNGKYLKALEEHNIENYLLVGVSVNGDHKVHMCVLANSKNLGDVITY